jgi:hypothetical protein
MSRTLLFIMLAHPAMAQQTCDVQLQACIKVTDTCQNLVDAEKQEEVDCRNSEKDLVEKLADAESTPKPGPAAIAYIGAAGTGAVIAGPVGAIVGTGIVAVVNLLGGF